MIPSGPAALDELVENTIKLTNRSYGTSVTLDFINSLTMSHIVEMKEPKERLTSMDLAEVFGDFISC